MSYWTLAPCAGCFFLRTLFANLLVRVGSDAAFDLPQRAHKLYAQIDAWHLCCTASRSTIAATMPKQATPKAATPALSGAGQHYALALELPIGADAKDVALSWALPAAAYVDKDEVETRGSWPACINKVQFTGNSDVEAPEYEAEAHRVGLRWTIDGCDTLKLNVPVHVRAPTPDASLLLGGRRRIPLDDFELRVDGRAYGRPADAAPLGAYAALPPGGSIPAWGVAVATLMVLFREALRVARCLSSRAAGVKRS